MHKLLHYKSKSYHYSQNNRLANSTPAGFYQLHASIQTHLHDIVHTLYFVELLAIVVETVVELVAEIPMHVLFSVLYVFCGIHSSINITSYIAVVLALLTTPTQIGDQSKDSPAMV